MSGSGWSRVGKGLEMLGVVMLILWTGVKRKDTRK